MTHWYCQHHTTPGELRPTGRQSRKNLAGNWEIPYWCPTCRITVWVEQDNLRQIDGGDEHVPAAPAVSRLDEIQTRLSGVAGRAWKYNPEYDMFVGTTNAIEMQDRTLDLGRDSKNWTPSTDPNVKGYVLTEDSKKQTARTKALGAFLENCREDLKFLLGLARQKENRNETANA